MIRYICVSPSHGIRTQPRVLLGTGSRGETSLEITVTEINLGEKMKTNACSRNCRGNQERESFFSERVGVASVFCFSLAF